MQRLRTNLLDQPLGIDTPRPEFSWQLAAGTTQRAYRIQLADSAQFDGALLWDSGQVESSQQHGVFYAGQPLASSRRYFWRVCLWGETAQPGAWSAASFETAKLDPTLWKASWITGGRGEGEAEDAALYLRSVVELPAAVVRGRAYVSALGWYRLFVNGHDLTGNALVPRVTPLRHMVEYQTYDVGAELHAGSNVLALAIGDGRYRGRLGFGGKRAQFGDALAGFAQFELKLEDGRNVLVVTDERWQAGPGRILGSDPKHGERVDLRLPGLDWAERAAAPAGFRAARKLPRHERALVAEEVQRVREVARLPARRVWRAPSGKWLVDLGQNIAGVVRILLPGNAAGATVRLTHGELLTPQGELDVSWIWHGQEWYQRDEVMLAAMPQWYQPWFTIHGFRYVEVDGLDGELKPEDVEGIVLSTDLPRSGSFQCSDPRLEQLYRNIGWSLRSNFTDTPTDCPTRERSGWTGDIQVFGAASTMLVDGQAFLRRYLRNLALEQFDDGRVPPWIPYDNVPEKAGLRGWLKQQLANSTGWGDVAVMLPWTLYRYYGDREVLRRQYDSMRRWVDHLAHAARKRHFTRRFRKRLGENERYLLDTGFHWGEWLRPGEDDGGNVALKLLGKLVMSAPIVATDYFAHSASLLSQIAAVLGHEGDAAYYGELSAKVRTAWRAAFVRGDGRIGEDKQDDYVRALAFELLLPAQRPAALARLVELIEQAGDHLGTGFLSTGMLLPVLAGNGRADVAYRILLQTTQPSWLYPLERGATTIWETWSGGYDAAGKGRHSHNHYALGAVAAWLQEGIAGLAPLQPGYRRIRIAPHIGGGLRYAAAAVETPYGRAASAWRVEQGRVILEVEVPPGTVAEVCWDRGAVSIAGPGQHRFERGLSGAERQLSGDAGPG